MHISIDVPVHSIQTKLLNLMDHMDKGNVNGWLKVCHRQGSKDVKCFSFPLLWFWVSYIQIQIAFWKPLYFFLGCAAFTVQELEA